MIKVSRLSHNFGRHWALKDVSFSLDKGDFLFVFGPSGAGKTSLLRLLHAALPLQRGAAMVAGYDLKKIRTREVPLLRRQVGVVFQDFKILPERSVFANVALPLEVRGAPAERIERRVRAVLRSLDLDDKQDCACARLSGGEQQRVAIARSVVVNPQLILADEPTGNLDRDLSFRLMEVFRQFHTFGTTVVLATHDRELVESFPGARAIMLRGGRVVGANWPGGEQPAGVVQAGASRGGESC
jgi:cell division transport system ATP-binding protein